MTSILPGATKLSNTEASLRHIYVFDAGLLISFFM